MISNPQVVAAYKVTLLAAGVASLFNAVFGMLMARILTRYRFPGRSLLDGLIDLPFALPTAVAGLTLAGLFSTTGWYGQWLAHFDIKVTFTAWDRGSDGVHQPAVCGAHRAAGSGRAGAGIRRGCRDAGRYALAEFPPRGVARGGTGIAGRHRHLLYPQLGEFGAVIFIAGNIARKTEVTSLMIFVRLQEFDYPAASAIASVITAASLLLLFSINVLQSRFGRRLGGVH